MIKQFAIALCAVACLSVAGARWAAGQEAVLETLYGSGVHNYFSGDYSRAETDLTAAIDGGSKDPRVYYFRALARMRAGGDATADLRKGGALETADVNQFYPVGRSLERVQGSTRATLERYRAAARASALARQQRSDAERYDRLDRAESQVLRAPQGGTRRASAVEPAPKVAVPNTVAPKVAAPKVAVPEPPAAEDPFAEGAAPKAAAPGVAAPPVPAPPVPQPPVAADDPFADDGGKKPAGEPAEEMPEESPAAKPEGDDPFGDPPAKEEAGAMEEDAADAKDAAPEPAKGESEDPFADPK